MRKFHTLTEQIFVVSRGDPRPALVVDDCERSGYCSDTGASPPQPAAHPHPPAFTRRVFALHSTMIWTRVLSRRVGPARGGAPGDTVGQPRH